MEISPVLLAKLLAYSCLFGIVISVVFGTARSLFSLVSGKPYKKFFCFSQKATGKDRVTYRIQCVYVFFLDVLLWIFGALGVVILSYYFNYGEIRGICVLGTLLGYFISHISVERLIVACFEYVFAALRKIILWMFKKMYAPMSFFGKKCKKMLEKAKINVINTLEKREKLLYNNNELLYIYKLSQKGFVFLSTEDMKINDSKRTGRKKNETSGKIE